MRDASEADWFVYHSWLGPTNNINFYPPGRILNIDKITWTSDQWPFIGYPSDTPRTKPVVTNPVPNQSTTQGSFMLFLIPCVGQISTTHYLYQSMQNEEISLSGCILSQKIHSVQLYELISKVNRIPFKMFLFRHK